MAVLAAATVPFAISSAAAQKPISVVDYAQCANGQPPSTAVTCTGGWINGILQASNSHFSEGDVTPQRLIVNVNTASTAATCTPAVAGGAAAVTTGCHSVTLQYQARKGNTHAYDSLATWNHTVTGALRCLGLTTPIQNALGCSGSPTPSTLPITDDPTEVGPFTSVTGVTSNHDLNGQELQMYGGGTLVAMTEPSHDNAACANGANCTDDYATTTIYYAADANTTVQLLFGGHIAVSPTNQGGWGAGLGASNINGGPYHIKWSAADGASVGNRDNQIMGSAIQPLSEPGISTSASPSTATIGTAVNLTDTVTLSGATAPTGTTSFQLFGPFTAGSTVVAADCVSGVGGNAVAGASGSVSTYTAGAATLTVSNFTFGAGSAGDYYWVATFAGDSSNAPAGPHGCGASLEKVTVSLATPTGSTTIRIGDSVTVSGVSPTGTVDFYLFLDPATCSVANAANAVYTESNVALSSASASTASEYSATAEGTYRWLVHYDGDTSNAAADVSNCVETATVDYP